MVWPIYRLKEVSNIFSMLMHCIQNISSNFVECLRFRGVHLWRFHSLLKDLLQHQIKSQTYSYNLGKKEKTIEIASRYNEDNIKLKKKYFFSYTVLRCYVLLRYTYVMLYYIILYYVTL